MLDAQGFKRALAKITFGLVYVSETDSKFILFNLQAEELDTTVLADALGCTGPASISSIENFFAPLIVMKEDSTPERLVSAKKFLELKGSLEENLRDLAVYSFGDVRKKILIVGRHESGCWIGVSTEAVETG